MSRRKEYSPVNKIIDEGLNNVPARKVRGAGNRVEDVKSKELCTGCI